MRRGGLLLVTALVLALAGCAGTSGAPGSGARTTASPPSAVASPPATDTAIALVGTRWHVTGMAGTTVRFDGPAITVAEGDRSSSYAWSAQGSDVLVGQATSSLAGAVAAPWLTSTTRVQRTGTGWTLLDATGATTAHLTPDGTASPTAGTALLTAATPGAGVVDAPASAIEGRWVLAGDLRSTITFAAGTWRATSSCTSGAVGGAGVYRVLPGGRLLVTRTMSPIRGCPVVDGPALGHATAITGIALAGSFRVRGGTLTLFDRSGTELGSLVRG